MDIAALAEELGLEEADARHLVLTFLQTTEQDLLLLEQAVVRRDAELLRQSAHQIKGAASNLECTAIASATLAIEEKARSGFFQDALAEIDTIRKEVSALRAQMNTVE
jgi:HPt (histidine-containing phosphotransfer) domain-containing protein